MSRIRRELAARWAAVESARGDDANANADDDSRGRRVLLLDFAGGDFNLGGDLTVEKVCALESPANPFALPANGFDGVVICLQCSWLNAQTWPAQALRALNPGGRLLFCAFGPDTLQQLRRAWQQVDDKPHVHAFADMHIIGDQLLHCGFTQPIVDADWVTVQYADADALHADLRAEGFINALAARRKTLTGAARFARYQKALEALRENDEPLNITFELIYGTATAPAPSSPASIQVTPPRMA